MDLYDRDGRPITMEEFVDLLTRKDDYRRVGWDTVGNRVVSTVWLGMDHAFGVRGPPLIFETMVFPEGEILRRYPTEELARAGHAEAVLLVMATTP